MQTSEALDKIAPALVKALAEVEGIRKDARNPHFGKLYASLEGVTEATRPILAAHGLAVLQGPGAVSSGTISLTTRIIHESGQWIESCVQIPMEKPDPQKAGSAITYARRYALMAMLNVPAVDDDGEAAVGRGPAQAANAPQAPKEDRRDFGPSPQGPDFPGISGRGKSSHQAKKDGDDQVFNEMRGQISRVETADTLNAWMDANKDTIRAFPESWRKILREDCDERRIELRSHDHSTLEAA
jgi:hypothetical protein